MPLAAVTSVKCSVRVPSGRTCEVVAEEPIVDAGRGGRCAAAAWTEQLPLDEVDVEVAVVVVVEAGATPGAMISG